jgi:hypothetical protein
MKSEDGAVEFGAVLILFFLSSLISGLVLFAQVTMTYNQRYKNNVDSKNNADLLLQEILNDVQDLKDYEYDYKDNNLLRHLESKYTRFRLTFADVSSGYHLDFLSDDDLADEKLSEYLFINKHPGDFIAWRNNNGLSTSIEKWKPFLRQEIFDACVCYGWLHLSQSDSYAFRSFYGFFDTNDPDKLFPLVNTFPLMNVNMVSPDILEPLIMRTSFKLEKPKEKFEALKQKLSNGPVLKPDISSILSIPVTNPLFTYLGVKTAFWGVRFYPAESIRVEAIIAAIPDKFGNGEVISEYKLIDRSIIYEY